MNKSTGPGTTLSSLLGDRNPFADKRSKKKDKDLPQQVSNAKMPPRNWDVMSLDMEAHSSSLNLDPINHTNTPHSSPGGKPTLSRGLGKISATGTSMRSTMSPRSGNGQKSNLSPRSEKQQQQQQQQQHIPVTHTNDITIYVGKKRTAYVQSMEVLNSSPYFRKLLMRSHANPIVVDCEESVFENVLSILRYKSIESLPPLSDSERYKLRKELELFGIEVPEDLQGRRAHVRHGHFPISDLMDFPQELTDPSKLVIVARLDDTGKGKCECMPFDKPSQWALSFHFRQAFCIGCSQPPTHLAPKVVIEMFQAAALYYSNPDKVSSKKWFVICDSTCALKFVAPKPCCVCPCSGNRKKVPMWAVSSYHCHAFCTSCGKCADGAALVCIMFTVRYGVIQKCNSTKTSSGNAKLDHSQDSCSQASQSPRTSFSHMPSSPRTSLTSQPSL